MFLLRLINKNIQNLISINGEDLDYKNFIDII